MEPMGRHEKMKPGEKNTRSAICTKLYAKSQKLPQHLSFIPHFQHDQLQNNTTAAIANTTSTHRPF